MRSYFFHILMTGIFFLLIQSPLLATEEPGSEVGPVTSSDSSSSAGENVGMTGKQELVEKTIENGKKIAQRRKKKAKKQLKKLNSSDNTEGSQQQQLQKRIADLNKQLNNYEALGKATANAMNKLGRQGGSEESSQGETSHSEPVKAGSTYMRNMEIGGVQTDANGVGQVNGEQYQFFMAGNDHSSTNGGDRSSSVGDRYTGQVFAVKSSEMEAYKTGFHEGKNVLSMVKAVDTSSGTAQLLDYQGGALATANPQGVGGSNPTLFANSEGKGLAFSDNQNGVGAFQAQVVKTSDGSGLAVDYGGQQQLHLGSQTLALSASAGGASASPLVAQSASSENSAAVAVVKTAASTIPTSPSPTALSSGSTNPFTKDFFEGLSSSDLPEGITPVSINELTPLASVSQQVVRLPAVASREPSHSSSSHSTAPVTSSASVEHSPLTSKSLSPVRGVPIQHHHSPAPSSSTKCFT